jgi:hypothetical protein
MKRAYRRPAEEAHVQRILALFNDQFGKGFGFAKSMPSAYTAVLSSPAFLFTDEKPGRLDDYALASRLSFFLVNSEPDENLRALAARGEIATTETLRAQTERFINDPKSGRFIGDCCSNQRAQGHRQRHRPRRFSVVIGSRNAFWVIKFLPPPVAAVEPDIRGAVTLRQQRKTPQ